MARRLSSLTLKIVIATTVLWMGACGDGTRERGRGGDKAVSLQAFAAVAGGPLLFVEVEIEGQGPFRFGVDTAASQSVIELSLAKRLGLEAVGRRRIGGATGGSTAVEVSMNDWRAGSVGLPKLDIVAFDLHGPKGERGLLGADVFASFGSVVVDYENRKLVFGGG